MQIGEDSPPRPGLPLRVRLGQYTNSEAAKADGTNLVVDEPIEIYKSKDR